MSTDHKSMKKNLEERLNTLQLQLPSSKPDPFETLTKIESGVLELLIKGHTNSKIAKIQYKSEDAVRNQLNSIYSKISVPGKDRRKCEKAITLYMVYHPKSFLESYTKEELENVKLIDDLTPRQLSVLECYGLGFSYKKIADKLGISKNTVKRYLRFNIFYKLYSKKRDIKKNIKTMRLYILRYPKITPSLYSQVKHLIANNDDFKKEIDIGPILSEIKFNQDLTSREFEALNELVKGRSNEEIAYRLFIDKNTLRSHIRNINKKWNIRGVHNNGNFKTMRTARQQIYTKALEMRLNSNKVIGLGSK